ncbi:MAG: hypothetical protein M1828_003204 [Chrysothrix sp. TS-e1954]|nr:MAG: hypothetical protein M1828_003204 [Chrysothrix sp. TS-e1954]
MSLRSSKIEDATGLAGKVQVILEACKKKDADLVAELAASPGGLVNDEARRAAWPLLLGSSPADTDIFEKPWQELPQQKDEDQVKLDVDRSFVYYPRNETDKQLSKRQHDLQILIVSVLRRHPYLCYFQGYHDIAQVLLLVLGPSAATLPLARLSLLRIRDFMLPTFTMSLLHLQLLLPILRAADEELERHVSVTQPDFAIASTLTMYAHQVEDYADIVRLFDFLIAQEAVVSIYLFAAIVLSRREELLEIDPSEPEMLHITMSKLPKPIDWDLLITRATSLFELYPPHLLRPASTWWWKISPYSVLKTTRDRLELRRQSLQDGEVFFKRHAAQVRRMELFSRLQIRLSRITRPYRGYGLAFSVIVVAWWLGVRFNGFAVTAKGFHGAWKFLSSR